MSPRGCSRAPNTSHRLPGVRIGKSSDRAFRLCCPLYVSLLTGCLALVLVLDRIAISLLGPPSAEVLPRTPHEPMRSMLTALTYHHRKHHTTFSNAWFLLTLGGMAYL